MKVLIVGLGSIAGKHIHALKEVCKEVNIFALRSKSNAAPVDGVIDIYDISSCSERFDFAIISNPTSLHAQTVESLLPLNTPLFIEKPLFHTTRGVETLLQDVNISGITTYIACNLRFHPCIRFIKTYLKKSAIVVNEVNAYAGSYLPSWRPGKDFRSLYSATKAMGGGVHLDLIHELDYIYWLWGPPLKTSSLLSSSSSLQIDAVDYANYLLTYERFIANITLNYYRRDAKRRLEIVSDETTITLDLIENKVTDSNNSVLFSAKMDQLYTYKEQMKYFISLLTSRDVPAMNNINEAFQILKICLNE